MHEQLRGIVEALTFSIRYTDAVDNGDGTYTLSGIKNIRHTQPMLFPVTIGGQIFNIADYERDPDDDCKWLLHLKAEEGHTLPVAPGTFNLYGIHFFHGTPIQQGNELVDLLPLENRIPMVYLMEPYETNDNYDLESAFAFSADFTLCVLSYADTDKNTTEQSYHNAIEPMRRLKEQLMEAIVASPLFYGARQKTQTRNHAKFFIYMRENGTKELKFTDKLAGVSFDIRLEVYRLDECLCCLDLEPEFIGASYNQSYNNSFDNGDV